MASSQRRMLVVLGSHVSECWKLSLKGTHVCPSASPQHWRTWDTTRGKIRAMGFQVWMITTANHSRKTRDSFSLLSIWISKPHFRTPLEYDTTDILSCDSSVENWSFGQKWMIFRQTAVPSSSSLFFFWVRSCYFCTEALTLNDHTLASSQITRLGKTFCTRFAKIPEFTEGII